ncbi:hypothetical protein Tco_0739541 [Tanacetum coccineum]
MNASNVPNKYWQKRFSDGAKWEPKNFRRLLLWYLEELDKLINERVLKYGELRMKESATLEACLVNEGITLNDNIGVMESSGTDSSERNDGNADIGPSYDSDTLYEVPYDMFENVFAHGIQSHEQPESIPNTYDVNENNSNIISNIPNMDLDRDKEEHDDVAYEQQRAFFASLINNLKCDVEEYCSDSSHVAKEDSVHTEKQGLGFENQNDVENPYALNKAKELAPSLYKIDKMGQDVSVDHEIISKEQLKSETKKCLKVKQRISLLSYYGFVYGLTQIEKPPKVPLKRREAMLKFEKETVSKQNPPREEVFINSSFEENVKRISRNRLSKEFEPLVKDVNLQLNCFEKCRVKEMKDDLKYVMSLEDKFDETCFNFGHLTTIFQTPA